MRFFSVVGNLKMNLLSRAECEKYLTLLKREWGSRRLAHARLTLCPPTIHLAHFAHLPADVALGAQDVSAERSGAFTGDISPLMLKDAGVSLVIVGHSERRAHHGETDDMIARKVVALLKHSLTPLLCIGETADEREREMTTDVLERQIRSAFAGLSPMQAQNVMVAYEPRWAIGTDILPSTQAILQVKVFLRKLFIELYDARLAERMRILYGGSVKTASLPAVAWEAEMDGVLVGRESLTPRELVGMLDLAETEYARNA